MKLYRLNFLDGDGRIARAAEAEFEDDDAAALWAASLPHDHGMELWQGARLVLCFTVSGDVWTPHQQL